MARQTLHPTQQSLAEAKMHLREVAGRDPFAPALRFIQRHPDTSLLTGLAASVAILTLGKWKPFRKLARDLAVSAVLELPKRR